MPTYQIVVQGHLDESWSEWFDDLTLIHQPDGTTTLTGSVPDQGRLFTILLNIRDMNLKLMTAKMMSGRTALNRDRCRERN